MIVFFITKFSVQIIIAMVIYQKRPVMPKLTVCAEVYSILENVCRNLRAEVYPIILNDIISLSDKSNQNR